MAVFGVAEIAAVGETVGGHIDHAHDPRPVEGNPAKGGRGALSRAISDAASSAGAATVLAAQARRGRDDAGRRRSALATISQA